MNVQGLGHPVTPYCCNTPTFKGALGSQPPLLQPQQSPSLTTVQTITGQTIDPDSQEVEFTRRGNFLSQGCIQGVINRIQWGRGHPTFFFFFCLGFFSSLVWFLLITHQGTIKYSFRPIQPHHGISSPEITVEITTLDALKVKFKKFQSNSHICSHIH